MKETHGHAQHAARGATMSSSASTPTKTNTSQSLLDGLGGRLGELFIPATSAGFADLLSFCRDQVGVKGRLTGVRGGGHRLLRDRAGPVPAPPRPHVHEVHRPPRKGERRMSGKSDTIDAEHAARQVLGDSIMAVPKTADGQIEALRLLKIARDTAVKAQTTAMITLKATLVTASDELRAELEPLSQTLPCPRDLPPLAAPSVCRRGTRGTPAGSGLTT